MLGESGELTKKQKRAGEFLAELAAVEKRVRHCILVSDTEINTYSFRT